MTRSSRPPADDATPQTAPSTPTASSIDEEVRLAVVMYGGVSLAIYMNGVAQELYRLVRATALEPGSSSDGPLRVTDADLTGTERVYRRLARMTDAGTVSETIRRRFVVDVLSGTSAGGINAVYLAKALATGRPIDALTRVWIQEGDVARLLNDKRAKEGVEGVTVSDPPDSLFNGQRMLALLNNALQAMDDDKADSGPLVDELDLITTATDLDGYAIPLHLSDGSTHERRHRHTFHFRYDPNGHTGLPRNDFGPGSNPVLAFAARCTSSFPIAFEPVQLSQIESVTELPRAKWKETFQPFFPRYRTSAGEPLPFESHLVRRAFADGGYLDNKPFGHAIDALYTRRSPVPTNRKLLYVEPNPSSYSATRPPGAPPNAIRNALAAYDLARHEPIVEDIERVIARNRTIDRVQTLTLGIEEDLQKGGAACPEPLDGDAYRASYLDDLLADRLPSYGGYHRLKVARVTDDIAHFVTAASGVDVGSDAFLLIRRLVGAWRDRNYQRYRNGDPEERASEAAFLMDFDLSFRMRRNAFLQSRIDRLCTADALTREQLLRHMVDPAELASASQDAAFVAELRAAARDLADVNAPLRTAYFALRASHAPEASLDPQLRDSLKAFRGHVEALTAKLDNHFAKEGTAQASLLHDDAVLNRVYDALANGSDGSEDPDGPTPSGGAIDRAAQALKGVIGRATAMARERWHALDLGAKASRGRQLLGDYSFNYECYDAVIYPALELSGVGQELDPVELLRVSPVDADAIVSVDEAGDKLAGTAVMSFGAFLDTTWREYDILWGRLDGAERLIEALVPGPIPDREALLDEIVGEAHAAILTEWVKETTIDHDVITEMKAHTGDTDALNALLDRIETLAADEDLPDADSDTLREAAARIRSALTSSDSERAKCPASDFGTQQAHTVFRRFFQRPGSRGQKLVRDAPEPRPAAEALGRALQITGRMLDGIATRANVPRRPFAWLAKLGSVVSGVVTVAVPGTLGRLAFSHWMAVLYLFELTLIGLGVLFDGDVGPGTSLQTVGLTALGMTALLHVLVVGVGWRLTGTVASAPWGQALRTTGRVVGLAVVIVLTAVGALVVAVGLFDGAGVQLSGLADIVERIQAWFRGDA